MQVVKTRTSVPQTEQEPVSLKPNKNQCPSNRNTSKQTTTPLTRKEMNLTLMKTYKDLPEMVQNILTKKQKKEINRGFAQNLPFLIVGKQHPTGKSTLCTELKALGAVAIEPYNFDCAIIELNEVLEKYKQDFPEQKKISSPSFEIAYDNYYDQEAKPTLNNLLERRTR